MELTVEKKSDIMPVWSVLSPVVISLVWSYYIDITVWIWII